MANDKDRLSSTEIRVVSLSGVLLGFLIWRESYNRLILKHIFIWIPGGDGVSKFSINSSSGVISALPSLDRETKDTYYLSITAQDGGSPPLTGLCAVRVFISDTNDNKPVFSPTLYSTAISEATPPGTDVIPVHAYDVDIGVNAEIEFSIVGGDAKTQFQVRLS